MFFYKKVFFTIVFCLYIGIVRGAERNAVFYRSKGLYGQGAAYCQRELKKADLAAGERKRLLFELAACYQFNPRQHLYRKTVNLYRQIIREYPDDPMLAKAYFNIGRCLDIFSTDRKHDIAAARKAYINCYKKYPYSPWAEHAEFWYINSFIYYSSREHAAVAVPLFECFLQQRPQSLLRELVHSQLSELYCSWLQNYPMAVKHSEAALRDGIDDINLKRLHLYRLAYLYQFKLKNIPMAIKWYKRLIKASPLKSDPNYFVAIQRLRDLKTGSGGRKNEKK